jgi:hypothetical protein
VGQSAISDQGQIFNRDIIRVDYYSSKELIPFKATLGSQEFLGRVFAHSGLFQSYVKCLSELPGQTQKFEKETGLVAVAAYCETAKYPDPSFSMVIEAFGVPERQLFSTTIPTFSAASNTEISQIVEAAKTVILGAGSHLAYYDSSHILYYSKKPVLVTISTLLSLSSIQQCAEQLPEVYSIFLKSGALSLTSLCLADGTAVAVSENSYSVREYLSYSTPQYSSYSDCMNDRQRVSNNFEASGGKLLGLLCDANNYSSRGFKVRLFYKGH